MAPADAPYEAVKWGLLGDVAGFTVCTRGLSLVSTDTVQEESNGTNQKRDGIRKLGIHR
jgi:hypothetical protein